jgi:hypothetical protein
LSATGLAAGSTGPITIAFGAFFSWASRAFSSASARAASDFAAPSAFVASAAVGVWGAATALPPSQGCWL